MMVCRKEILVCLFRVVLSRVQKPGVVPGKPFVARHLGQFNGAYLTGQSLPEGPWVSRGWIRQHVAPHEALFAELKPLQHQPEAQQWFLDDDAAGFVTLWADRAIFLDALDRLPQTFVHRDAFRRNLFARRSQDDTYSTVAVDWAYSGIGAIGEELVCLVCGTLSFFETPIDDAQAFESLVFDGYLAGLNDAGWSGDPRLVRLGYAAGSAMVFGLGYRLFLFDADWYPVFEGAFGKPMDEIILLWKKINRFTLNLGNEARRLMVEIEEAS